MIRNTCLKAGTFSRAAPSEEIGPPSILATEALAVAAVEAAVVATASAQTRPRPILVRMGSAFLQATARPPATVSLSELEALKHVADIAAAVPRRSGRPRRIPVRRIVIGGWSADVEPVVDRCE